METQKSPNSQNNQKKEKLQYMESQRVGYDLATKQQQILIYMYKAMYMCISIYQIRHWLVLRNEEFKTD